MSQKVLVTGGAGYIGSVVVPELLRAGYRVTVLDNFRFRQNSLAGSCHHENFTLIRGDVCDKALMQKLVPEHDIFIPLAALVGAPLCAKDPELAKAINRDALQMMVSFMTAEQKILIPITNSGYGIGIKDQLCTEESPLNPISLYGKLKVEAEQIALKHKNAISFRLATVFGMSPRMRIDLLVNDFTHKAVYKGCIVLFESHFKRNYIHVHDVTRAFMHGIQNFNAMKGQVYNVGLSDANISKWELCERIQKYIPTFTIVEAPIAKDPDQRDYIVSNAKIEATGFLPQYSLDAGIQELIKGYTMSLSGATNI